MPDGGTNWAAGADGAGTGCYGASVLMDRIQAKWQTCSFISALTDRQRNLGPEGRLQGQRSQMCVGDFESL